MDGVNGDNVHKYFFWGLVVFKNRAVINDPNTRNTRINASRISELSRKSEDRSATTSAHRYGQLTGE
jgi:hypothetical protein